MGAIFSRQPRKITAKNATKDVYYDIVYTYLSDPGETDLFKLDWEAVLFIKTKISSKSCKKASSSWKTMLNPNPAVSHSASVPIIFAKEAGYMPAGTSCLASRVADRRRVLRLGRATSFRL